MKALRQCEPGARRLMQSRSDRLPELLQQPRSAKQIEHDAVGHDLRRRLLKPELVGASHHRTEQELVIQHNGYGHRADRSTDRREIALLDSAGDIGADTGKRYPNVAN